MNLTEWYVPVNAHPAAVRWRSVGETKAVEPSDAATFLPVIHWPEQTHRDGIPVHLMFTNRFHVPLGDARHFTALRFPG